MLPGLNAAAQNWTPDGRYFLFRLCADPSSDLWAARERQAVPQVLDRHAFQLTNGLIGFHAAVVSRDCKKLFAIGYSQRGELLRLDAKSREFVPWLSGVSADGLAFSPDGAWVAYTLWPEHPLAQPGRRQCAGAIDRFTSACAAATMVPRRAQYRFHGKRCRQPAALEYLPDRCGGWPTWSPDGKSLAFAGAPWLKGFSRNSTAIHVLDLQTRKTSMVPGSEGLWAPKWSTAGRYILAARVDSGTIGYATWSHAGDFVYFNVERTSAPAIYRVGMQDPKLEAVASPTGIRMAQRLGEWFGLSPDDSPLLLRDTGAQEIYALDMDFP